MASLITGLYALLLLFTVAAQAEPGRTATLAMPSKPPHLNERQWEGIWSKYVSIHDCMQDAPIIRPQDDGIIYLNIEAAGILRRAGTQRELPYSLVPPGSGIQIRNGRTCAWDGNREIPCWKINLPKAGRYRVILNRSVAPDRESTICVTSWSRQGESGRVTKYIENTGSWDDFAPYEMGESNLPAGEQFITFTPQEWKHGKYLITLVDLRLIPLDDLNQHAAKAMAVLRRVGVYDRPEIKRLKQGLETRQAEIAALAKQVNEQDFSNFTDYSQFIAFDRAEPRLEELKRATTAQQKALDEGVLAELERLRQSGATLSEADMKTISSYFTSRQTVADAATKAYENVYFKPRAPAESAVPDAGKTLFETGNLEALPIMSYYHDKYTEHTVDIPAPVDAAARRKRFAKRNSDAAVAELTRQFQARLIPGTPGLEEFEKHCAAGKFRQALEAYRTYFFDKLRNPQKYGARQENLYESLVEERGKGFLLKRPNPRALEHNLDGRAAVWDRGKEILVGNVGSPGAVNWADPTLTLPTGVALAHGTNDPYFRTPEGTALGRRIAFYRCLNRLPQSSNHFDGRGLFLPLFFSYAATGNADHLQLWFAYLDDWCMNMKNDLDNCPVDIREAVDHEVYELREMITFFRLLDDEHPDFESQVPPATLARFLMFALKEKIPYTIRARRSQQANWSLFGLRHILHVTSILPEFKASDYFRREAWRLLQISLIQHRTLDGENMEAWDMGHNYIDVGTGEMTVPFVHLPTDSDDLAEHEYWDMLKTNMRNWLVHMTPWGVYWPDWGAKVDLSKNNIQSMMIKNWTRSGSLLKRVIDEPEVRNRVQTVLAGGKYNAGDDFALPAATSEIAPYAAMYYLRSGWTPDSEHFVMQNFTERSQEHHVGENEPTMYRLSKSGRILLEASGLVVNQRRANQFYGLPGTGGKTEYCTQVGRKVRDNRFHTSERFDFAESLQAEPYADLRTKYGHDPRHRYGGVRTRSALAGEDEDPAAVTDVQVLRQVFSVRGEGLYIINDIVHDQKSEPREYAQFFTLPLRLEHDGIKDRVRLLQAAGLDPIQEDETARRFRTGNVDFDNVSIRLAGPEFLTFANSVNRDREHVKADSSALEALGQHLAKGGKVSTNLNVHQISPHPLLRPVSARWQAAGDHTFMATVYTRPAVADTVGQYADDLREFTETHGRNGVRGVTAVTRTGTRVWFQSGPRPVNQLQAGPAKAQAQSLLAVSTLVRGTSAGDGGEARGLSGIVLGCETFSIDGEPLDFPCADFEFVLNPDTHGRPSVSFTPILKPIDTVVVHPETNVFIDTVRVSFDIPTQSTDDIEFRYTLDGSDPTLQSKRYNGPFSLRQTTMVKVRPFRKGLAQTPWNFPGLDGGKVVAATFRKQPLRPAIKTSQPITAGLAYDSFEGDWPELFTWTGMTGVLAPLASGTVGTLLDTNDLTRIRKTDRAYAIRYDGFLQIPENGTYTFYAPKHLYDTTMDAGYDLRVWIDGEEWYPAPTLHSTNAWHIPLAKGLHNFQVAYVDYRWRQFRDEYWMDWQPEQMWQGTPVLEISGPGITRKPIPAEWIYR